MSGDKMDEGLGIDGELEKPHSETKTETKPAGLFNRYPMSRKAIWSIQFFNETPVFPFLTCALLATLAGIYVLEVVFALGTHKTGFMLMDTQSLLAMGSISRVLILKQGEWYRLFTGILLHGGFNHILFNSYALFISGLILERLVSRAWVFIVFALGGLCGAFCSFQFGTQFTQSVGASGAIMAVMAAGYVLSFKIEDVPDRNRVQGYLLSSVVVNVFPVINSHNAGPVDYYAHFGGAVGGFVIGFALFKVWKGKERFVEFQVVSYFMASVLFALFAYSACMVVQNYGSKSQALSKFIPDAQVPRTDAQWDAQVATLLAQYPDDPRPHFIKGGQLEKTGQYVTAEKEMRLALVKVEDGTGIYNRLDAPIRYFLIMILVKENHRDEALQLAHALCANGDTDPKYISSLKQMKLCY
jgi:rhomboid protease GluP